jgi:hypothetical protein
METGLRMCLPEKGEDNTTFAAEKSVLCSPVCLRIIARYGHVFAYFSVTGSEISLQSRLRGGGKWIRTLGPVLRR